MQPGDDGEDVGVGHVAVTGERHHREEQIPLVVHAVAGGARDLVVRPFAEAGLGVAGEIGNVKLEIAFVLQRVAAGHVQACVFVVEEVSARSSGMAGAACGHRVHQVLAARDLLRSLRERFRSGVPDQAAGATCQDHGQKGTFHRTPRDQDSTIISVVEVSQSDESRPLRQPA